MNPILRNIPNALTCMNLVCGCYACILALCGNFTGAMMAIFVAAGFDFLDGFAARLLKAFSPIGKDLDSLADVVSFGVAPGMMIFHVLDVLQKIAFGSQWMGKMFLVVAFLIPVFSALRLAKFNNDERQTLSFIGLPVPANAIFWSSLLASTDLKVYIPNIWAIVVISALVVVTSLLLVSEIPMFSLKIKYLSWKGNELRYVLTIAAIISTLCLGVVGLALTVVFYVLLSIFAFHDKNKWQN